MRLERRKGSEGARSRLGGLEGFDGAGSGSGVGLDMGRDGRMDAEGSASN